MIYQTSGIVEEAKIDGFFACEIAQALAKFLAHNWGDTCAYDKNLNKQALINGDRIVALFNTSKGRVFIITETDCTITTILFG